ncbi:MAG TPA: NAD(P)-binding domain-containing protein, partial [Anaerolineaceae bacterium]|nr:NAD(P)-binding domain-containing protein [Anaerolineaceae bacterium]
MKENCLISIIGPGVMAEAFIGGLLRNHVTAPEGIVISGPRQERVDQLHEKFGVQPFTDNALAVKDAENAGIEEEDPT